VSTTWIFSVVSAKTRRIWLFSALILCLFSSTLQARSGLSKRWIYVSTNPYVDGNVQKLEPLLRRAPKNGAQRSSLHGLQDIGFQVTYILPLESHYSYYLISGHATKAWQEVYNKNCDGAN